MAVAPSQGGYEFGGFHLDPRSRSLIGPGGPITLTAKAFDALVYLVEHAGQLVERRALMSALWPKTVVEDNNLNQAVAALRKALGDGFIATIPGRGYQFVARVSLVEDADTPVEDAGAEPEPPREPLAQPDAAERPQSIESPVVPNHAPESVIAPAAPSRRWRYLAAALTIAVVAAVVVTFYASRAPTAAQVRLAILPFENLSPNPDDAFFTDGLHWEILSTISNRAPGLEVVSRRTMMLYRAVSKPLTTVATELGATHVLEGSVRRSGNDVRLMVQLSDGRTDKLIWSHEYPRTRADVLALETEVADAVAGQLRVHVVDSPILTPTANPDAYDSYLKGRLATQRLSGMEGAEAWRAAEAQFSNAIERDPMSWRAYLGRAAVRRFLVNVGYAVGADLAGQADADLAEARRLAGNEPVVLAAEAVLEPDPNRALALFERAEARGLADPEVLWTKVPLLIRLDRWTEALDLQRHLANLDPANTNALFIAALYFLDARQPVDAARMWDLARAGRPEFGPGSREQTVFMFTGKMDAWRATFDLDALRNRPPPTFDDGPVASETFKALLFFGLHAELRRYLEAVQADSLRIGATGYFIVFSMKEIPTAQYRGWCDLLLGDGRAARADGQSLREYLKRREVTAANRWYPALLDAQAALLLGDKARAVELAREAIDFGRDQDSISFATDRTLAAQTLAWAGADDDAVAILEALAASTPGLPPAYITRNPLYSKPLAGNARYQALVKGLEAEMAALHLE